MELQCDMCSLQFDLDNHRPKVVPCGHSICQTCAQNPALKRKCPAACTTDLTANPGVFPDNILAIRMIMEKDGAQSRKRPRLEDAKLQHLRRGVDAGRELVRQLQQVVPRAVAALNCQMNSALAHLRHLEEALEKHQREGAGAEASAEASPTPDEVQLVVQLEDSVRLLSSSACSVVAEQGADSWRASVTLFPFHHVLRLLLLQLRAGGQLQKVEVIVAPPTLSTLVITNGDVDAKRNINVGDILRNEPRWKNIRTLKNLNGRQPEELLRVVAPHLEELEISDVAVPSVLKEVESITSLKRLLVKCSPCYHPFYPDLPLQLEELEISSPSGNQLRCVQRMSRLRSLKIRRYTGAPVAFRPQQRGGLMWLGLDFPVKHKGTMLSLIRANASSLQELYFATISTEDNTGRFFPNLGPDLAACGFLALRRLVLTRPFAYAPCDDVDRCLLQRRTVRSFLPSVEVVCYSCNKSYGLGF